MSEKKTIVVGGITGGIGASLARRLSKEGCTLYGFARDQEKIDALKDELGIEIGTVEATNPEEVEEYLKSVKDSAGGIDAYVHAVGSIFLKPAHLTSPEDWQEVIHKNLDSAFYALRACTKVMQKQKDGCCLFFSTAAAQTGIANHEAIAAAKGGIEAMVRAAAATYSSRGLRFNAIAPSLTDTPLAKPVIGSEQGLEISKRMHPLGRVGDPEEVAGLAAWLVSGQAGFVTGQTFVLDGGISSVVPKPKA
jgi:NAD(P)-dependent dehydrogenase (short-subunit alcohol dehydrogenase family)